MLYDQLSKMKLPLENNTMLISKRRYFFLSDIGKIITLAMVGPIF